jgi:chromate transport protein ChrA
MLPGPGETQLAILIGHAKGGPAGGILDGICFIISEFSIMVVVVVADTVYVL